ARSSAAAPPGPATASPSTVTQSSPAAPQTSAPTAAPTPVSNGAVSAAPAKSPAAAAKPTDSTGSVTVGEPIRGAASRIVANMETSLEIPTATSFREVPAKLLEVNRKIVNG